MLFAVIGTLAALQERSRSGVGQEVDVAIYEAVMALMESTVADWEVGGVIRERQGGILRDVAPANAYPTADGHDVVIAGNADAVFARLATAMGRPDLARDYATHEARAERQRVLDDEIVLDRDVRRRRPARVLRADEVPVGLINRVPDLAADPHIAAREMIVRVAAGFGVDVPMTSVVPRFSRTPGAIRAVGPELGAHTDEVLSEFYAPDEIAALRAASIIT